MEQTQFQLLKCPACGTKNRIPAGRIAEKAACGKCGQTLKKPAPHAGANRFYNFRCRECGTRNRIPAAKINDGPKCGKCSTSLDTSTLFIPQPVIISDGNFENLVTKSPLPVLLFAWAPWCPTCGSYVPIIDEFARDAKTKVRVAKLNVDANPMLSSRFNILSVPFLFIFDNGQMKENMPGGLSKQELMMKLAPYL